MARSRRICETDDAGLGELARPRDTRLVLETAVATSDGPGVVARFEAADGPFKRYERTVEAEPLADGRHRVTETTSFKLAIPVAWVVFTPAFRHAFKHPDSHLWWAPPERFSARASTVIAQLAILTILTGYVGSLLSQTTTFAADEFGNDSGDQSLMQSLTRIGVIVTLGVVALADRKGRRRVVLLATVGGCIAAALTAFSPNLAAYGATQGIARGFSAGLSIMLIVLAAEEAPAGARAYVASLLALVAGLGSGMVVWFLPIADVDEAAWRLLFLLPLIALPIAVALFRNLPESQRFEALADAEPTATAETGRRESRRFTLLAFSGLLVAFFAAPASNFQNDFLRDDRDFSASRVSLFQLTTNTPVGIGVVIGGWLADRRGRRPVGAVALTSGVLLAAMRYSSSGWTMWLWGVLGAIVAGAAVPALAVYGPELFGTERRATANGGIAVIGTIGAALGLLLVGFMVESLGHGPAFFIAAIAPLTVALLVLLKFPETAQRELEDINPDDPAL